MQAIRNSGAIAAERGVRLLVFHALSRAGYEPAIARSNSLRSDDSRLDSLRPLAEEAQITMVVGAPALNDKREPHIGAPPKRPRAQVVLSVRSRSHLQPQLAKIRVHTVWHTVDHGRCAALDVDHYNTVHLHSAIGYVTPQDMLAGRQAEIHAARDRKLEQARSQRQVRGAAGSMLAHSSNATTTVSPGQTETGPAGK